MKLEPEMINKDFIGLEEANFGDNGHLNKEILGASKRGTRDNNCIGMSHEIGLKPDSSLFIKDYIRDLMVKTK